MRFHKILKMVLSVTKKRLSPKNGQKKKIAKKRPKKENRQKMAESK